MNLFFNLKCLVKLDYLYLKCLITRLCKVDSPVTIILASISPEDLILLLGVFSKNAIAKATRHVKLCGRNGVTRKDMEYALKYEVFDFLGNPDVFSEISRIRNAIQEEIESEGAEEEVEEEEESDYDPDDELEELEEEAGEEAGIAEGLTDAIIGDNVVPDSEIQEYSEIQNSRPSGPRIPKKLLSLRRKLEHLATRNSLEQTLFSAINRI